MKRIEAPARIAGFGIGVPSRVLSNADLERMVDTSDEWIVQRTGIRTRRVVSESEYASTLAFRAIDDLLANHPEIDLKSVDYVIVASTTADYVYPSLAAMTQLQYGLSKNVGAIDIAAACAGYAYCVNLSAGLIASGQAERVLVVTTEALSLATDYTDRATAVLFGDGGAAAIVERSQTPQVLGMSAGADGFGGQFLYRTSMRSDIAGVEDPSRLLRQKGQDVYKWVMQNIPDFVQRTLDRAGMTLDDVTWFVPHSANLRMIEALNKRLKFPMEKTLLSVEEFGNTSAVSIPLAVVPAIREGRVKRGDVILQVGFGGGLVSAGNVVIY